MTTVRVPSEVVTTFFKAKVLRKMSLVRSMGERVNHRVSSIMDPKKKRLTEVKRSGVSGASGPSDGGWALSIDLCSGLIELQGRNGGNEKEDGTVTTRFNSSRSLKSREVSSGLTRTLGTWRKVICP